MSDDEFRVGRPPEAGQSPVVLVVPPAQRGGPGRWLVISAAVVLIAAAAAGAVWLLGIRPATVPGQVAATQSGPAVYVAPTADIGEEAACVLLLPSMQDAAQEIQHLADHPDGSTLQMGIVRQTIANFEAARQYVPADMRPIIDEIVKPLRHLDAITRQEATDGPLDLAAFKDAGRRFVARCLKYGR